jgi:hypothetical protein
MKANEISVLSTTIIAFFTFLATWGLVVYYSIILFNFTGYFLITISEIYILLTLLFIRWVKGKIE